MYKIYLSILLSTFAYAQTVNFEDVLNLTLSNNKDLKNQQLNINSSKLDTKIVDAISYGKMNLSEEISRTNHAGYVFNSKLSSREASFNDFGANDFMNYGTNYVPDNLNNPEDRNNFTTKLTYDIPLFTGFKLSNQKDILKLQQKANELKYQLNEKELSYEVLKAYNGAVVAKEFIKTTKKAKEAISQIVKSANAFHKEGLVTKIDVKQAQVFELSINSKITQAQNQFDLAIAYLRFLSSNETILDVNELKIITQRTSQNDFLYTNALKNRDEVKIQNIQVNALKKNIEISKSDYYPNVYSHLEYGFNDNKLTLDDEKDYYIAMLGINYTIFDKTRDLQKQKSKIEFNKANINYEKLKDGIKLELEKASLELEASKKILNEKMEAKNLAQEVLEQSQLMYKNHLISMTDLLNQEANLRKYEAELIVSKYENSLALAKLSMVMGEKFYDKK